MGSVSTSSLAFPGCAAGRRCIAPPRKAERAPRRFCPARSLRAHRAGRGQRTVRFPVAAPAARTRDRAGKIVGMDGDFDTSRHQESLSRIGPRPAATTGSPPPRRCIVSAAAADRLSIAVTGSAASARGASLDVDHFGCGSVTGDVPGDGEGTLPWWCLRQPGDGVGDQGQVRREVSHRPAGKHARQRHDIGGQRCEPVANEEMAGLVGRPGRARLHSFGHHAMARYPLLGS